MMSQEEVLEKLNNITEKSTSGAFDMAKELMELSKEVISGLPEKERKIVEEYNDRASKLTTGDKQSFEKLKKEFDEKLENGTA